MKTRLITVLLIISILLITISTGCSKSPGNNTSIEILNHKLTVQKFVADLPSSVAIVTGSARNRGNVTLGQATIVVTFYGDKGNLVDTASGTINDLQPGETWNFSIQTKGTEAWKIVSYNIKAQE